MSPPVAVARHALFLILSLAGLCMGRAVDARITLWSLHFTVEGYREGVVESAGVPIPSPVAQSPRAAHTCGGSLRNKRQRRQR